MENNISYRNDAGFVVWAEFNHVVQKNIILRNNIAFDNLDGGILFGSWGYPDYTGLLINSSATGNTLYNNNINGNSEEQFYIGFINDCVIGNNIIYGNNNGRTVTLVGGGQQNLTLNYNLYFEPNGQPTFQNNDIDYIGLSDFQSSTSYESNGLNADPQFVSIAENPNLHLQSTSPAINAGNPDYIPDNEEFDMDGEDRINISPIDCGADEYYSVTNTDSNFYVQKFSIFPNPTTGLFTVEGNGIIKTEIYNITGKIIKTYNINEVPFNIDIREQPKGIYFVRISTNNEFQVKKVILQ